MQPIKRTTPFSTESQSKRPRTDSITTAELSAEELPDAADCQLDTPRPGAALRQTLPSPPADPSFHHPLQISAAPQDTDVDMPTVPDGTGMPAFESQTLSTQIIPIDERPPSLQDDQVIVIRPPATSQVANPFRPLLPNDVASRIIDYVVIPSINPGWRHDDKTLDDAIRACFGLACASKALYERMKGHRFDGPHAASIKWLRNINCFGPKVRNNSYSDALAELIHNNSDVRLPHWPDVQKRRTDIFFQRLIWSASGPQTEILLFKLFEQTDGKTLASDHEMFIDSEHVALSFLSAIVHRFGFDHAFARPLIDRVAQLHSNQTLSKARRAEFWAEVALGYPPDSERYATASSALDELIKLEDELRYFRAFVDQARAFLYNPHEAPDYLRDEMLKYLLTRHKTLLEPSSVRLLVALTNLVETDPEEEEEVKPLSGVQSALLQGLLVRYLQALCAMYTPVDMFPARVNMTQIPEGVLISAFSQLDTDAKFKIVDIPFTPTGRNGIDTFLPALRCLHPVIQSFSEDNSVPVLLRLLLVNRLLQRVEATSSSKKDRFATLQTTRASTDLLKLLEGLQPSLRPLVASVPL